MALIFFFLDMFLGLQSMEYMNVKLIFISKEITAFAAQGDVPMRLFFFFLTSRTR